nr:hypothetical protein CFP56_50294 [Quercus suber]
MATPQLVDYLNDSRNTEEASTAMLRCNLPKKYYLLCSVLRGITPSSERSSIFVLRHRLFQSAQSSVRFG